MDAPPVQYVKTSDGYDIAYTISGTGPPVVVPPLIHNHVQFNWHNDVLITRRTRFLRRLSESFRVVAFDNRGQGMSSRGLRSDLELKAFDADTAAVANSLGAQRFAIIACARAGHLAVRYAAAHPERVTALVLISCPMSMQSWPSGLFNFLPTQNWDFFLRTQLLSGLSMADVSRGVGMLKETSTPGDYEATWKVWQHSNISDLLPRVSAPMLVLHPRDFPLLPVEESSRLAARTFRARLIVIDGNDIFGDANQAVQAIEDFLGDLPPPQDLSPLSEVPIGSLTPRQLQVLRLVGAGRTNPEISEELVLSLRTVERHLAEIYAKLEVRNRAEAAIYALTHSLID